MLLEELKYVSLDMVQGRLTKESREEMISNLMLPDLDQQCPTVDTGASFSIHIDSGGHQYFKKHSPRKQKSPPVLRSTTTSPSCSAPSFNSCSLMGQKKSRTHTKSQQRHRNNSKPSLILASSSLVTLEYLQAKYCQGS